MNKDLKQNIILGLLLVNLVTMYAYSNNIKSDFRNRLDNLHQEISDITHQVNNLDYSVEKKINEIRKDSMNHLTEFSYDFNEINIEEKTIHTNFNVTLRELSGDSRLYLNYKVSDSEESISVELTNTSGLMYTTNIDLELNDKYSFNVIEAGKDGSSRQMNYEELMLDMKDLFYNRRATQLTSSGLFNNRYMQFDMRFIVNDFGVEDFALKSIKMVCEAYDKELFSKDITDEVFIYSELTDEDKAKINNGMYLIDVPDSSSNAITSMAVSEEAVAERQYMTGVGIEYIHQYVLMRDDYPTASLEEIRVRYILTFKDGHICEIY